MRELQNEDQEKLKVSFLIFDHNWNLTSLFGIRAPEGVGLQKMELLAILKTLKEALLIWLGRQKLCKGRELQTLYSNTHVSKWRLLWSKSSDLCVEMMCGIDGYSWLYYGDRFVNFFPRFWCFCSEWSLLWIIFCFSIIHYRIGFCS